MAADDVVSGALGAPVSINPTYDVTVDGSNTECLFTAGGHLASERLAVLITKRGADAFVVGVMDTPDALSKDTTLTQAVLDGQAP